MRRFIVPALVLTTGAACVQVLGYDDYRARSESSAGDTGVSDTATIPSDSGALAARPPPRPEGARTPSNRGRALWLGAKRMYFGTTTALGVASSDGWRDWGFDLDSVCTSLDDATKNIGTCRRDPAAREDVLLDGDLCRDNNFGRHVMGLLKVSNENFETRINEGIFNGNSTWVVRIEDVDDGADDAYAPARFYAVEAAKGAVKWDGTDLRRASAESVVDRNLETPLIAFPSGYVRDHVWYSGEPLGDQLVLPFSTDLRVPLRGMTIMISLDADHRNGKRGAIAGVMPMIALEGVLRPLAEAAGICRDNPLYESLYRNLSRFPDVVVSAPNFQDETVACDGMSLGMGFDVQAVQPLVEVVDPSPPDPSKCSDAGAN